MKLINLISTFLILQEFCRAEIFLSNLNATCIRCICEGISNCDVTRGCEDGQYCGPFYISRIYWADAGKIVLSEDDPNRENAFSDCVQDYRCSTKIVTNYMIKYAKDCNNDKVVDCLDYASIHLNGYRNCIDGIEKHGVEFLSRFNRCKLY